MHCASPAYGFVTPLTPDVRGYPNPRTSELLQGAAAERFAFRREPATLGIGESQTPADPTARRRKPHLVDRLKLLIGARLLPSWRRVIAIVQPETVLRWHRAGFRLFWRRRSRPRKTSTGQPRQTYRASSRYLADATLSPGGSFIVGGANDGLVWFWDAPTGRPLWTLHADRSPGVGVHFEGSDLVTRGFGGDVSRWEVPKPERTIEACNARAACAMFVR
jgi:hypothetical protein